MKKYIKKSFCILLAALIFTAAMKFLSHEVKDARETKVLLPAVEDVPVYVECRKGEALEVCIIPKEDISVSGLWLLLVNISGESRGTIRVSLKDDAGNLLTDQVIPVDTVMPGEWFNIPAEIDFRGKEAYTFSVTADESEPYFMSIQRKEAERVLPFTETVSGSEECISLGVSTVTAKTVTFGQIFYFSVPLCIILFIFGILGILFGFGRLFRWTERIPWREFPGKYGNEMFLLLLFAAVCISIYSRAYLKGVYISSDSAGYLREAVCLINGYGFSYDGMAGYDSWFANWPVLYPAMIASVMAVTGADAYLASKILSMIIVGAILLLLWRCFKKDAWVYALSLTNLGFLGLTYYTWSEIPFLFFLLCFGLVLARILSGKKPAAGWYPLLGVLGFLCFLTRYYGIFVWIVTGLYLLLLLNRYRQSKEKETLHKAVYLTAAAFVSGCLSLGYLLMNKLANGMASGVSRSLWWDDYEKLTNDLIESLLLEIFNVFSLQVPQLIENFPYNMKVLFLAVIFAGLFFFVRNNAKRFTRESVLISMAVIYYVVFIGIRYVSSMDTFYFRFFEPGSFLFSMGIAGLLIPYLRGKKAFHYFGGAVSALIFLAVVSVFENGGMDMEHSYYESLTEKWDASYAEIPEKSVIIFNDIDFRSSYYRPDVVDGTINPEDTLEEIRSRYYGSDYLCIRRAFAEVMLEEGEYDKSVKEELSDHLSGLEEDRDFVVISLRQKEE